MIRRAARFALRPSASAVPRRPPPPPLPAAAAMAMTLPGRHFASSVPFSTAAGKKKKEGAAAAAAATEECPAGTCQFGQCMDKLGEIMYEYRKANYAQTLPSRFAKEIVTAADKNRDGVITVDEIHGLLENIGAADRMTDEEIDVVLTEMGIAGEVRAVPVERVLELMKERARGRGISVNAASERETS